MKMDDEKYARSIQDKLRELIESQGLTYVDLSITDVPPATLFRYTSGIHTPNIKYVAKIAHAMGVSVDYLIGLSPHRNLGEPLSPDIMALINSYNRADERTKKLVMMQLEPNMTDFEKEAVSKKDEMTD